MAAAMQNFSGFPTEIRQSVYRVADSHSKVLEVALNSQGNLVARTRDPSSLLSASRESRAEFLRFNSSILLNQDPAHARMLMDFSLDVLYIPMAASIPSYDISDQFAQYLQHIVSLLAPAALASIKMVALQRGLGFGGVPGSTPHGIAALRGFTALTHVFIVQIGYTPPRPIVLKSTDPRSINGYALAPIADVLRGPSQQLDNLLANSRREMVRLAIGEPVWQEPRVEMLAQITAHNWV